MEEDNGADLLSTHEDNTAHSQYIPTEREVLEQIPIHFVENETVKRVSTNDGISPIERLLNEILEEILSEVLLSSGFSWPNHVCRMHNNLCKVNIRFRDIAHRLVSMLPIIYFSDGGELGIVSLRSLIKKWHCAGGTANNCHPKLGKCLAGSTISWFGMVYHPQRILAKT